MFSFTRTEIDGLFIISPHTFEDDRGIYKKFYEKNVFSENGIVSEFTETSEIFSTKGAMRGLHYQTKNSQAKLLHVIKGKIFDVALDLRSESKTFGKYHCEVLKEGDGKAFYIPGGFAHGFITLSDKSIFSYQCSGKYEPDFAGGILWNDLELDIPWPLKEYGIANVICTEKDKSWPTLREYCASQLYCF